MLPKELEGADDRNLTSSETLPSSEAQHETPCTELALWSIFISLAKERVEGNFLSHVFQLRKCLIQLRVSPSLSYLLSHDGFLLWVREKYRLKVVLWLWGGVHSAVSIHWNFQILCDDIVNKTAV